MADSIRGGEDPGLAPARLFLANMSHEIRTPIQTIIGMLELLGETRLDEEQAEYLKKAKFSAEVLVSLVTDVLDFSKIEAGRLETESIDFDIRKCVAQAADMIALEAHKKGLELVVDVADDIPAYLRGDPTRLRQIILNLTKNAAKFTERGEIFVSARRAGERSGAERLRVEVSDTGIGVPEEARRKLFSPFHQADSSHTRKYGGSGLGLAISKRLAELMGGGLSYRPGESDGSVFALDLPLNPAIFEPPDAPEALVGRLLIVDDSMTARIVESRIATSFGLDVESVSTGERAIERLRKRTDEGRPFAACAIDLEMPHMDGWRLASEIRSAPGIAPLSLVLMSPEGSIGAEAKMKLLDWFETYVNKPVKRGEFRESLARALGKASGRAADDDDAADLDAVDAPEPFDVVPDPGRAAGALDADLQPSVYASLSVLVAEDHEVNRALLRTVLERSGCAVTEAGDGEEAARLGSDGRFDLVFMDIQMPKMTGYEAAKAIRAARPDAPIIAVTANAEREERERCRAAGMDDVLVKPFGREDIEHMLEFWTKRSLPARSDGLDASGSRGPSEAGHEQAFDDLDALDFRAAVETFLGDEKTVSSLLLGYLSSTREAVRKIDEALAAGRLADASAEAHRVKGSAWNLRAKRLGASAEALELASARGDAAAAEIAAERLKESFFEFAQYARHFAGGARDGIGPSPGQAD